jgi:hypothetical protein
MSTTTEAGLSIEKLLEVSTLVKRAGDQAVQLRIVERFLSEIERRLLKTTPQIFDIERLKTALQILKTLSGDDDIDECLEAEFRLDEEFRNWSELIVDRDQKIETYHFRRLCDSTQQPLEDDIFIALAKFYRELDLTASSQSKFDLSITRLFTRPAADGRRETRCLRSDIVKRLKGLFASPEVLSSRNEVGDAVTAVDAFIDEALGFVEFEDLVRSNIFDRYRVFKRELGYLFFEPEVLGAAVECNVVVGNVFDGLLRSADEQLSSRLTVDVDLASALHDPAPESRSHINDLFRVFFGETEANDMAMSGDVDYLGKLLSMTATRGDAAIGAPETDHDSTSAQGRLAPFLRTLTEARPDSALLLQKIRRSESLKNVDVNDFLFAADGQPDVLCRRALGLVLWSLEFRENELKQSKELTESIQREATSLLYKAEHLGTKLQHEVEVSDELNENRLRAVLNALLDSRLKLERGIVRFTNRKIAAVAEATPNADRQPTPAVKTDRSYPFALLRWAVIGVIAVAAIAGAFSLLQKEFGQMLGNTSDLSEIDVRTFQQHDWMRSAYRHDKTLFITARGDWSTRPAEERSQIVHQILENPNGFKFQTVVVMNEAGTILENVSRDGEYLDYSDLNSVGAPSH